MALNTDKHHSEEVAGSWLETRFPAKPILEGLKGWTVGSHRSSYWMFFGGTTLFFFGIQVLTGMLLLLYYSPTPETAHESVYFIISQVPFGWLIRSIHAWSSNLLVGSLFIHFFSTMLLRSYRKPRELVWITGMLLMFIMLGFAFTGYLLPWDTVAYAGTNIGVEMPASIPVIGGIITSILRGGDTVGAETLKRLFALHVSIFPLLCLVLTIVHLMLRNLHGLSVPIGSRVRYTGDSLYPEYLLKNAVVWTGCAMMVISLAMLLPATLGAKADMLRAAPAGIKPEWYFLFLYETMNLFPTTLFGLNGEMVVNGVLGAAVAGLVLLPFFDRKAAREERSSLVTVLGIGVILYMVVMTILGYRL